MNRRTSYTYGARRPQAARRRPRWLRIGGAFFVLMGLIALAVVLTNRGGETPALGPQAAAPSASPSATPSTTPSVSPAATPASAPDVSAQPTAAATPSPSMTAAPSPAGTPTAAPAAQSSQTDALLSKASSAFGSDQVVVVLASGNRAQVALYEKDASGDWKVSVSASGAVGRNGVSANRKEGDGSTPAGVYKLGFAFGNSKNPGTKLTYRDVTETSYWVDDSASKYYNQWVEGTENKDWDSAEALAQIQTNYAYAVVVEYNYGAATVAGKGSAIFLHCGTSPTSGCIAIPQSSLVSMLKRLDPAKAPSIAIEKKK